MIMHVQFATRENSPWFYVSESSDCMIMYVLVLNFPPTETKVFVSIFKVVLKVLCRYQTVDDRHMKAP